ncbi:MAG: glycosyltransferase family 4 protein [Chloroflexaceae bacterium]|nr:glycosyltransferase family 4 protein [Chloroflexaceae bacterium]
MRVLMISWEYPPHMVGGLGRHVADLAPQLTCQGIDITLLTPWSAGALQYEEITPSLRIVRVPLNERALDIVTRVADATVSFVNVAHALWQQYGAFDLIHVHDWLLADVAITLKHHYRRPLMATIHASERGRRRGDISAPESRAIDTIEWRLTYEAWRVVVCSHYMVHQLVCDFHLPYDKIDMVPNGVVVPPAPFDTIQDRRYFRMRFQPFDAPLLFAVGRLVHEKGWHVLIAALAGLRRTHQHARLVLAGVGAYRDELQWIARQHDVLSAVTFAGFISDDDRNKLYASADIAVFPSLYEPFGIVALEAMALRCPVVVSDTGGLREVVQANRTGVLVPPDNVEALVDGLVCTLNEPSMTSERINSAFDDTRITYGWQTIAASTAAVYGRIIAEWQNGDWGH